MCTYIQHTYIHTYIHSLHTYICTYIYTCICVHTYIHHKGVSGGDIESKYAAVIKDPQNIEKMTPVDRRKLEQLIVGKKDM